MLAEPYLVSPANTLAFRAVEACLRGDEEFRLLLLTGPRGAGKTALMRWAQAKHSGDARFPLLCEDPLRQPLPEAYPAAARIIATLDEETPGFSEIMTAFQSRGGRILSLSLELELTEAVARETIASLGLEIDDEALRMLVDRLTIPAKVRGALLRLQAEAALQGRRRIDALFLIRSLGDFLFPPR